MIPTVEGKPEIPSNWTSGDPNNFLDMDLARPEFCAPAALKVAKPVDVQGRVKTPGSLTFEACLS